MPDAEPTTTFKLKGPIFKTPAQVSLGFQEAVNRGLLDLATIEGSNRIKEQLYPGHGRVTGNLRNHIGAGIVKDNVAQIDAGELKYGANITYANLVEGIDAKNKTSRFKGYQMFENVYNDINNNPKLYEDYILESIVEAFD